MGQIEKNIAGLEPPAVEGLTRAPFPGVISHIDSMGQIHLEGYGLAIIPEVDEFEVIQ